MSPLWAEGCAITDIHSSSGCLDIQGGASGKKYMTKMTLASRKGEGAVRKMVEVKKKAGSVSKELLPLLVFLARIKESCACYAWTMTMAWTSKLMQRHTASSNDCFAAGIGLETCFYLVYAALHGMTLFCFRKTEPGYAGN